jgi:TusA-related sulfurtransferase
VLDEMENPDVTTLAQLVSAAMGKEIEAWLKDRKNRRSIPHRLEKSGYVQVRNDTAKDGLWKVNGTRQVVYGKSALPARDRLKAAGNLMQER